MPSPIGHSLAGLAMYQIAPRFGGLARWQVVLTYCFVANAADLDFIPGLLLGQPNRFHHRLSHSIGAALIFVLIASLLLRWLERQPRWRDALILLSLYVSHVFLDYFSKDTGAPIGVPMFWPLSNSYFISPFAVFTDIERVNSSLQFLPSLFTAHNLWAATLECLVLAPLVLVAFLMRKRRAARPL
jgi:inner membrane protein